MALISKLPAKEKRLARKRRREHVYSNDIPLVKLQEDILIRAFDWSKTKEGAEYWNNLDNEHSK